MRVKSLELTLEKISELVFLILPIGSFAFKTPFNAQGEPTYPKIQRVGGITINL